MTPRVGRTLLSAAASNATAVNAAAHDDATAPLWFIFISLAVGSAARTALHGTSVPYTVVLFIIGMVMAVLAMLIVLLACGWHVALSTLHSLIIASLLGVPVALLLLRCCMAAYFNTRCMP